MPRFYFHLYGENYTPDEEGAEFASFDAALVAATRSARSLAAFDVVETGVLDLSHCIEIADDRDELIARVLYGDAVQLA